MTSLFDRVKRETNKATFEADRLLRIRRVEGTIADIRRQITQQAYQIGSKAIELSKNGQLDSPPELAAMCKQVQQLEQQITEKEAEIERIRQEIPPEPAPRTEVVGPAVVGRKANYGHICPKCEIELPAEALFCPQCGGPAKDVAPPPTPVATAAEAKCVKCGAAVPAEAAFCPRCGSKVGLEETPSPAGAPPNIACARCGAVLVPEAVFCPACGNPVEPPAAPSGEPATTTAPPPLTESTAEHS
jgi:RNA polymerase subunit RPABC4/transcription elongation factor Spt4